MTEIMHTFSVETEKLEERVIAGLAAPYGETIVRDGRKLRFEKGMFSEADSAHLYFNHDGLAPIGRVVAFEDTDEGLRIKAKISKTVKGDEVYTLLQDGVLDKFSVGFVGLEQRQDDDVTVWTKVDLHEISVVPRPAFKTAAVAQVHSADSTTEKEIDDNTMSDSLSTEVGELKEAFSDLERKVVAFGSAAPAVTSKFASGGEALKALATGSTAAKQDFAFTGATTADANVVRPGWVNRGLQIVDRGRPVLNLFAKAALPATGNSIEYPVVSATTGDVALQANEGDDLTYLEVALSTATAPIKTYGGYSALSRQAIERSDVSYLDAVLRYQTASYAKVTNAAVRTALTGATGVTTLTALSGADTAKGWVNLVLDAAAAIDANGQGAKADFIVMSPAVYKRVVGLVDNNARVQFNINGDGSNTVGNANVLGRTGSLAGLPIVVDTGLAGNTVYISAAEAVTVFEQSGAPFRLQDENIINLTKEFSLYGYMAIGVTNPGAIVKVSAGTGA